MRHSLEIALLASVPRAAVSHGTSTNADVPPPNVNQHLQPSGMKRVRKSRT
jgi:hypothetical protein